MVMQGLAKSREQAGSLLMSGKVFVNQKRVEKSGQQVPIDSKIDLKGKTHPWVSRGGIKLEKYKSTIDKYNAEIPIGLVTS